VKPGDLVQAWCVGWPASSRPRDEGMMLMRESPSTRNADSFFVSWNLLGIVVYVEPELHDTIQHVLVMVGDRIGWNTINCFDRVHDAEGL
jgi:hypothetical protein